MRCIDCRTSCPAGMYMQGNCSGLSTVDTVECIPCPANTFSIRSGINVSSCIPCSEGTFSDPGSPLCAQITSGWPLNTNTKEYKGHGAFNTPAFTPRAGIKFETSTVLGLSRSFMTLSGGQLDYVVVQEGDCSVFPVKDFSASAWVRMDSYAKSGFIGCFRTNPTGADGWFLGTTADGQFLVFVLRGKGSDGATMIADMREEIKLGSWYVCLCPAPPCMLVAAITWLSMLVTWCKCLCMPPSLQVVVW